MDTLGWRRLLVLVVALLSGSSLSASANDPEPGYIELDAVRRGQPWQRPELVELFWVGCPDCGRLEPLLDELLQRLPGEVDFQRVPVIAPGWEPSARAYYAAGILHQQQPFHRALSRAVRVEHRNIRQKEDLIRFAASIGMDEGAFREAYQSPQVRAQIDQAADLTKRYRVDGVPSLVVDRRYRISLQSAGDMERMLEIAERLLREAIADKAVGVNDLRR